MDLTLPWLKTFFSCLLLHIDCRMESRWIMTFISSGFQYNGGISGGRRKDCLDTKCKVPNIANKLAFRNHIDIPTVSFNFHKNWWSVIISTLQTNRLKLSSLSYLPQVTQLESGRTRIYIGSSARAADYCHFSRALILKKGTQWFKWIPRGNWFLPLLLEEMALGSRIFEHFLITTY